MMIKLIIEYKKGTLRILLFCLDYPITNMIPRFKGMLEIEGKKGGVFNLKTQVYTLATQRWPSSSRIFESFSQIKFKNSKTK